MVFSEKSASLHCAVQSLSHPTRRLLIPALIAFPNVVVNGTSDIPRYVIAVAVFCFLVWFAFGIELIVIQITYFRCTAPAFIAVNTCCLVVWAFYVFTTIKALIAFAKGDRRVWEERTESYRRHVRRLLRPAPR